MQAKLFSAVKSEAQKYLPEIIVKSDINFRPGAKLHDHFRLCAMVFWLEYVNPCDPMISAGHLFRARLGGRAVPLGSDSDTPESEPARTRLSLRPMRHQVRRIMK
uniref:Uncharacterized protein n=1 Tax=Caenorhabditis japonica TaxID=281687 RepID=A0A8R1E6G7_CAEJA